MLKNTNILTALCIGLALLGYAAPSSAQQNLVTAIDIALEPDQTMIQHAKAAQRPPAQGLSARIRAGCDAPTAHHDAAAIRPHG